MGRTLLCCAFITLAQTFPLESVVDRLHEDITGGDLILTGSSQVSRTVLFNRIAHLTDIWREACSTLPRAPTDQQRQDSYEVANRDITSPSPLSLVENGVNCTLDRNFVQEDKRARLPEVVDAQATPRHDQLEPTLRIGEDGNVLQGISLDDEQIRIRSRRHDAHLSLHPQ